MTDKETILIVDDERLIRMTLRQWLEKDHYTVVEANDAQQAFELLDSEDPDLMLLEPTPAVVIITAEPTAETAIDALSRGAIDHLVKPLEPGQLEAVVARALATRPAAEPASASDARWSPSCSTRRPAPPWSWASTAPPSCSAPPA